MRQDPTAQCDRTRSHRARDVTVSSSRPCTPTSPNVGKAPDCLSGYAGSSPAVGLTREAVTVSPSRPQKMRQEDKMRAEEDLFPQWQSGHCGIFSPYLTPHLFPIPSPTKQKACQQASIGLSAVERGPPRTAEQKTPAFGKRGLIDDCVICFMFILAAL